MVPEIPVGAAGAFDIGANGNKSTTGLQAAANLIKGSAESGFVRQVFEKIARKNDIKGGVLDLPGNNPARGIGLRMPETAASRGSGPSQISGRLRLG